MDLYDDIIVGGNEKSEVTSKPEEKSQHSTWSSTGINLLKDHLQLKKSVLHGKKDQINRRSVGGHALGSSFGFKPKIVGDEMPPPPVINSVTKSTGSLLGGEWDVTQEYDPLWPNDYEKIMKERKEKIEKEASEAKAREMEERLRKKREKESSPIISSLPLRPLVDAYSDDEDDEKPQQKSGTVSTPRSGGAAFPPPPSLIEDAYVADKEKPLKMASSMGLSSVAAKIMVKMGYKDGQGLGKEEQGISRALEVQKTSQRGGKIISEHEKEVFIPPPPPPPPPPSVSTAPTVQSPTSPNHTQTTESITEIMKNPTKVVLLKNMVGRGEVDEDLEPEVKEECSKYGDVVKSVIFEMPVDTPEDEAVRIFVEFKRVESAIKAVVDLNGRYFGGRVVKATFYDVDKFKNSDLRE